MSRHTDSEAFHAGPSSETLQRPDGVQWRVLPSCGLSGAVQGGWSRQRGPRGQRPAPLGTGRRPCGVRGEGKSGQICCRGGALAARLREIHLASTVVLVLANTPWSSASHLGTLKRAVPGGARPQGPGGRYRPSYRVPVLEGTWRSEERRTRGGPLAGFWGVRGWPVLPPDPRSLKLGS